ncbi:helix-turn-helix domain-containing protein [Brevibacterium senegalense]|uniref:helix-turn-helix domain-containing protein n=1 Tax=Brevibacterium senegalense TaxID=1033736 RepID=UPI001375E126|nr:helix-turn-helix domain-containing protein [Brevibacterium senegalense]
MPRRVEDYRGLTQVSRLRLLRAVQRKPGRLLQELADEAQVHLNTARDHLRVLEEEGLIVSAPVETGRRGRPPLGYSPVRRADHSPQAQRRADEAKHRGRMLRTVAPELDPSDDLGPDATHQLDALYEHLDDAGLQPEVDESRLTVGLLPCLYQDLIDEDRPLVCSVHAKLVRHQLEQVHGPLELARLHPFVEKDRCLLVLALAGKEPRTRRTGGVGGDQDEAVLERHAVAAMRSHQN